MALSPWSNPVDPALLFPLDDYESLLFDLGWSEPESWLNFWLNTGGVKLACDAWPLNARSDWLWGLGLPFLTDLKRYISNAHNPVVFGLSGLPGCGKTSFGSWLEAATSQLDWPVTVVSMDDFYLPAAQLHQAMLGNPWNVPRALPGSHSIDLLLKTIDSWMETGDLLTPQFDKSLRNGLGDRCGWRRTQPKALIVEGWFLGCTTTKNNMRTINFENQLLQKLSRTELEYQKVVQSSLEDYQPIWKKFQRIWHLKASQFSSTSSWKSEQEKKMEREKGFALNGKGLESFIRMIHASIPQESLQSIDSDVVAILNRDRQITWVGSNKKLRLGINKIQ
tara:strand:- start:321 stop:1328 length:1008 start_codon:yes stop_codon:yes gene_type:complete